MNRDNLIGADDLNRARARVGAAPVRPMGAAEFEPLQEQQEEELAEEEEEEEGDEVGEDELDDYDIIRSVAYYALKGGEQFGVAELVDIIRLRDPDDLRVEMLVLLLTDIARESLGARGQIGGERMATMLERDETLAQAVREARDLIEAEGEVGDAEVEQVRAPGSGGAELVEQEGDADGSSEEGAES